MGARGDLRHHAAEGGVLGDLRQHDVGQDVGPARPPAARPPRRRSRRRSSRCRERRIWSHYGLSVHRRRRESPIVAGRQALDRRSIARSSAAMPLHSTSCASARAAARWRWRRRTRCATRLAAAHGVAEDSDRDRGHPHHRRLHPGPAAGGGRRQGPVHQGDRGGAARRRDRPRRAFGQGHADRAAGRASRSPRLPAARGRARRLHQPHGRRRSPSCRRARSSAPPRCAGRRWSSGCGPISRSCACAATSRRGCASSRAGEVDATLLALAGLKRLGLADAATAILAIDEFLPAVGQGAIAIEARADDARTRALLAADRRCRHARPRSPPSAPSSRVLDGSCRTPIAGHAARRAAAGSHFAA